MNRCPVCNGELKPTDTVCPACGFKLVGSTQEFEPISLDTPQTAPAATAPKEATMRIVRGPQNMDTTYHLDHREMTVGRSPQCDLLLNDMTVSRSHAVILPVGQGFAIKDEGSFNGVWINNENVSQQTLHNGDIVQIGAFCLLYSE